MSQSSPILVTGARGMLGTDLCEVLSGRGLPFIATDIEELELADRAAVSRFVEEHRPRAVINCAAYTAVDQAESEPEIAFRVNRDGARNLAEAVRSTSGDLVHVSTDYVFDGRKAGPYTEEDPTNPLGVYGKSKLAGEEAIRATCPRHCIIRTAWLYGVHGKSFPRTMLELKQAGRPLRVVTDQMGSPTYTSHLAVILVEAAERRIRGTYHAVGAGQCSWYEFACEVISAAGMVPDIEPVTTADFPRPAPRPANSVLSTEKLESTLGVKLPRWQDGAREFVRRWMAR
jgi:dTDP-4-dehydrorhamnose reductase